MSQHIKHGCDHIFFIGFLGAGKSTLARNVGTCLLYTSFVKGMTQIEIAKKLGISQVQVSRLLRRTLKKIQHKIDPDGVMIRS